jgi:hypothetical protein
VRRRTSGAEVTLIGIAKVNDADPQAWLADVLARIADTPQTKLAELLPWKWSRLRQPPLQSCGRHGGLH